MAKTSAPLMTAPQQQDLTDDVGAAMMTGSPLLSGLPMGGVLGGAGLLLRMQGAMGNQAAQAIANLRGPGLDALEGYADGQLQGLAASCKGTSGLDVAAAAGAVQAQRGVELGVGAARFGIDSLAGLIDMATNPLDTVRGIETMAAHSATLPWWARKGCGLGADMLGMLDGDTSAQDLLHNLTKDPITQKLDDNTYWRGAAEGMVAPIAEPLSKGRYWEASGYAMAGLASLLLGEEATLGKVAKATRGNRALRAAEAVHTTGASLVTDTNKVESGTLKAWRAVDDAGTELGDGVSPNKLPGEIDNQVARASPPLSSRDAVVDAIRKAYENVRRDPRFSKIDPEAIIQNMRYLKQDSYVQRLVEEACFRDKSLSPEAAFQQISPTINEKPAFIGPGIERFLGGAAGEAPEVRTLHVLDQINLEKSPEAMQHELIHFAADPSLNRPSGLAINEGITQWLTESVVPCTKHPYADEVAQARWLAARVGRESVLDAFHRGGVPELERLRTQAPARPTIDLDTLADAPRAQTDTTPFITDDPSAP